MSNISLGLITLAFIAAAGIFISVMLELRSAVRALNEFIKTTDKSLKPTLDELQMTLKSLRNVTDNVTAVTDDVKALSGSVRDVGENVRHVSGLIDDVAYSATAKISGLRAGIRAALDVILRGILTGKSR